MRYEIEVNGNNVAVYNKTHDVYMSKGESIISPLGILYEMVNPMGGENVYYNYRTNKLYRQRIHYEDVFDQSKTKEGNDEENG